MTASNYLNLIVDNTFNIFLGNALKIFAVRCAFRDKQTLF